MQGPAGLPVPSNAMSTTPDDLMLRALIAENGHVRTDLHWLLTAAIEFTNRYDSGALTVVLQDSALMHGRTLIEFTCFQPKSGYFRLVDFLAAGETAGLETVDWSGWHALMSSQTSHLSTKRDPGVAWPYAMTYKSRDRMYRLADDVLRILEVNAEKVREPIKDDFVEMVRWARGHLDRREPPSLILPASP